MTIENILKDYWGQISFVLLGAGYLIKNIFDDRQKRFETRYSLFVDYQIKAVDAFFKAYVRTIEMWQGLDYKAIIEGKMPIQEIDDHVMPALRELRSATLNLRTFFDKKNQIHFALVVDSMLEIFDKVKALPIPKTKEELSDHWLKFYDFRNEKLQEADQRLDLFSQFFKEHFLNKR